MPKDPTTKSKPSNNKSSLLKPKDNPRFIRTSVEINEEYYNTVLSLRSTNGVTVKEAVDEALKNWLTENNLIR